MDTPSFLQRAYELIRGKESDLGIVPSRKWLHTAYALGKRAYNGLKIHLYPSVFDRIVYPADNIFGRLDLSGKILGILRVIVLIILPDGIACDLCTGQSCLHIEIGSRDKTVYPELADHVMTVTVGISEELQGVFGLLEYIVIFSEYGKMIIRQSRWKGIIVCLSQHPGHFLETGVSFIHTPFKIEQLEMDDVKVDHCITFGIIVGHALPVWIRYVLLKSVLTEKTRYEIKITGCIIQSVNV